MSGQNPRRRFNRPTGFSMPNKQSALGYWIPLAVTVTVATVSLVAWVYSERHIDDNTSDTEDSGSSENEDSGYDGGTVDDYPVPEGYEAQARSTDADYGEDPGMFARFQGALRRTPSPQQLFDGASRHIAAGMAAAGAAVGGALSSIREERGDFEDHSRWTEEIAQREGAANASGYPYAGGRRRRDVAVVVSSVGDGYDPQVSKHSSILAQLPDFVEHENVRIFVLIYAPGVQPSEKPATSLASSYSNINPEEATTPSHEVETLSYSNDEFDSATPYFKDLYTQAQALVDDKTMIMPFSTETGHLPILRNLGPEIVYIQESLAGSDGETATQLTGWVRQVVIVLGYDIHGGLIDSEDEGVERGSKWWQKAGVMGAGKPIDVVDGVHVGEDWQRRVSGHD